MNDRRNFYVTTIKISWSTMTKRERKRLFRKYPLIAISLDHLLKEHLLEERTDG